MTHVLRGMGSAAIVCAVLGAGAARAQLSAAEQKCVVAINKDTVLVNATAGKLGYDCIRRDPSVEACMDADAKLKIAKKLTKLHGDDGRYCASAPAFAYATGLVAGTAAVQTAKDLLRDVIGNPIDSGVYSCATDKPECACQLQVVKGTLKAIYAAGKAFVKCKGIALGTGTSAAAVEDCVTNASGTNDLSLQADPRGVLSKARGKLVATLAKSCHMLPNDPFAAGACPGAQGPTGADCLMAQVKCRLCQMVDSADALSIDCSAWSGASCP